ncbi:MAG: hypothetical protein KME26_31040 [Oscillatoria princeps RMCB-10]|nr:hypothetical protein [Oscillatoria princeps RMCB-10]
MRSCNPGRWCRLSRSGAGDWNLNAVLSRLDMEIGYTSIMALHNCRMNPTPQPPPRTRGGGEAIILQLCNANTINL